jgi:hypothetical protein
VVSFMVLSFHSSGKSPLYALYTIVGGSHSISANDGKEENLCLYREASPRCVALSQSL